MFVGRMQEYLEGTQTARHTFGHGLTFQSVYTWSHAIDDSTSTYYQSGVNDYDLSRWKATSGLNRTHVLTFNYIYTLPLFKGSSSALVRQALGGWQISGITSFFSGEPVDFGCGVNGFGTGIGGSVRCNSVGLLKIKKGVYNDPQFGPTPTWFDGGTFAQPLQSQLLANGNPGMFGYQDRNPLTGPGRNNTDLALLKNFTTPWFHGESSQLQFRIETFNTFNHPQFNGINAGCDGSDYPNGDKAFGRPCNEVGLTAGPKGVGNVSCTIGSSGCSRLNAGNGQVNSAWASRIMQLGLKFIF
jgi:hypothetical protein